MKQTAICFFVAGTPAGQPRVKASARGKFITIYTPKTVTNSKGRHRHPAAVWKEQIAATWEQARPAGFVPITGPLKLTLSFFLARPKSHFNSKGNLKPTAPNFAPKKPDFDNLEKAVADQLTNSGAWEDDDQVCISITVKRYADSADASGCEIQFEILPE